MKLKINLDKNTIQQFFVNHLEKILFGMVVACFLLFVVNAVGRDVYSKASQELAKAVDDAEKHLANTKPEADREPAPYPDRAKRSRIRIEERFYAHETPWDWQEFQQRSKRVMPKLFTVQKLRGMAGAGPFALSNKASMARPKPKKKAPKKDDKKKRGKRDDDKNDRTRLAEMRGPNTKGERWIVITGLVPVTEQEKEFYETFKDAQYRNPETDLPVYAYYRVERAEVGPQGEAAEPNWVRFNLKHELTKNADRTGGTGTQDTCDSRCLHQKLCWPLGPLTGRKWGEEVAHPPEIPLHPKRLQGRPGEPEQPDPADPKTDDSDNPDFDAPGRGQPGGARGRRPRNMGGEMAPGGHMMGGRGMMPGGEGGYADSGMMGAMGRAEVELNPYLLFRFFDFNVEPGKKYRYRVRLMLRNPNYGVDPRWLKDKKLALEPGLETDWSDPTDVVSVPYDDRLLATGVKASAVAAVEPFAKVMLVHRDEETGQEIVDDVARVVRGKLMNYADRKGAEHLTAREVSADFMTESVLLDIRGGEALRGRDSSMTRPGRMLVLDVEGNLRMHDELGDLIDTLTYKKPDKVRPRDMMNEGMMPGEMPGDMMMPDGGFGEGNLDALGGEGRVPKRKKSRRPRRSADD